MFSLCIECVLYVYLGGDSRHAGLGRICRDAEVAVDCSAVYVCVCVCVRARVRGARAYVVRARKHTHTHMLREREKEREGGRERERERERELRERARAKERASEIQNEINTWRTRGRDGGRETRYTHDNHCVGFRV